MGNEHPDRTDMLRIEAERCVACGLCLPHCPTYAASRLEAESPRGRIALARGLATGALAASATLTAHLSSCTQCRACEKVCPAKVRYGTLIDGTLELLARQGRRGGAHRQLRRWLAAVLTKPGAHAGAWLRAYRRTGLRPLVRSLGLLRLTGLAGADALLPTGAREAELRERYPPHGDARGKVALFTGCVSRALDGDTLEATIYVLTRLGYEVRVPAGQGCCGALALHEGEAERAQTQFQQTMAVFGGEEWDAIISTASGCGATLMEYDQLSPGEPAVRFAKRVRDINQFLAEIPWPEDLVPAPLARRVAVQDACTLRNVLRAEQTVYRLLQRIPDIDLLPLAENHLCCGGAGTYPLREPQLARAMAARKLEHLHAANADLLVSANIGCALHLGGALRDAKLPIPVLHPVVLLAQQLGWRSGAGGQLARAPAEAVS